MQGWNDMGSWKAIWENSKKDDGNTLKGKNYCQTN